MTAPRSVVLTESIGRIEAWILGSGVQLREGLERGGVAGWLDGAGRPEFVYLEITGYFLTAAAWLSSGAASSTTRGLRALDHGRRALAWMTRSVTEDRLPPTRLHLSPCVDDWRNTATFSFDLAMAARGVADFGSVADVDTTALLRRLCAHAGRISGGSPLMVSHTTVGDNGGGPPARWSTEPGPHHLKAAAAFLRLPVAALDEELRLVCSSTMSHWRRAMRAGWPCPELHPLLYGVEGLFLEPEPPADGGPGDVELLCSRLLDMQRPDGTLPSTAGLGPVEVRSDVLAQALRAGALLRLRGALAGPAWALRLDALASALLRHVRPDGGIAFSIHQDVANAWCAMFAHQALVLYSRTLEPVPCDVDAADFLI